MGGDEESDKSTFTYVSYASPRAVSGSQERRREFAATEDEDDVGRASLVVVDFC